MKIKYNRFHKEYPDQNVVLKTVRKRLSTPQKASQHQQKLSFQKNVAVSRE